MWQHNLNVHTQMFASFVNQKNPLRQIILKRKKIIILTNNYYHVNACSLYNFNYKIKDDWFFMITTY